MSTTKKGFTLLELLIVIGILAILATATVLVLNPAELLRQSRDAQRISDLASLIQAIGLYITTVSAPDLNAASAASECSGTGGRAYMTLSGVTSTFTAGRSTASSTASASTVRLTSGAGWLPVNLGSIPGGSPLPTLPVDPSNDGPTWLVYQYACDQGPLTYELNAKFESAKFNTTDNLPGKDGGDQPGVYEIGTAANLAL